MGLCESDTNKNQITNSIKSNKLKEINDNSKNNSLGVNENVGLTAQIKFSTMEIVRKSICKIIIYTTENDGIRGTGFFILINNIKYLMTNYHNINKNTINNNIILELYNNKKIKMKYNNRNIKYYEYLDITIIEINELDELNKYIEYLKYDRNYEDGYEQYIKPKPVDLIIAEYPENEVSFAAGRIINIIYDNNYYEFKHNLDTKPGSSGSPIILLNSLKVIGIHKSGDSDKNKSINYGTFIGEIFKNNINKNIYKNINENYIISEIYISKDNINKDIQIINSYEEFNRNNNWTIDKEEYKNEKEIKECIIEINNEKILFSYKYNFKNEGKYKIKYSFHNLLTNCNYMFYGCKNLTNLDLSNFNTQNVEDMSNMFSYCSSLTNLDLSNFNTQNVKNMSFMFSNCSSLTNLNLSNFNTQNVEDMRYMFDNCKAFKIKSIITKDLRLLNYY